MSERGVGCLGGVAVVGLAYAASLGALWLMVRVVAHAWSVAP